MAERAPQTQDKFIIRLPDGMRERIKSAADANNRTMTAEIVTRLTMTFDAENVASDARSKEAAKRLLAIGMPGADQAELPEKLEARFRHIEKRIAALETK